MPKELEEAYSKLSSNNNGDFRVNAIKFLGDDLYFDFSISTETIDGQDEIQNWQMHVLKCRDSKIDFDNLEDEFRFYSDHFLLWEFTDKQVELYFKKGANNPELLFADIYILHHTIYKNLIPLEKFTNASKSYNGNNLLTLCKADYGLFAKGPKRILEYYYNSLTYANTEPYYFGDRKPLKWDGKKFIDENKDLKLVLLGSSYFIGQDFKFNLLQ